MTAPPKLRPQRPFFSSGPCVKPPGWSLSLLEGAALGRYHRSRAACERLDGLFAQTRALLGIPGDYRLYLVPGSDTGAFEAALWNLLGPRPVDVLAWDRFGRDWLADARGLVGADRVRAFEAADGVLPDLGGVSPENDVVFTWTGTTTGVAVPDGDWIADRRGGLIFCDGTSAAFAVDLPWSKLDATSFSWQKAMGGEAQHGFLILSGRALERLRTYCPARSLPKLFRLNRPADGGNNVAPVNTPSLLCIEDALVALHWIESIGGLPVTIARTRANFALLDRWVASTSWVDHLVAEPAHRAMTPVCLRLDEDGGEIGVRMAGILSERGVAHDIAHYRRAPPGLRLWSGPSVEGEDLARLLPWLGWAYEQVCG